MNFSKSLSAHTARILKQLRQLAIVFAAGLLVLGTVACSPQAPNASVTSDVPEASQADVQRAQGFMSDEAVNEDVLSQQGESQIRRSNVKSGTIATPQ